MKQNLFKHYITNKKLVVKSYTPPQWGLLIPLLIVLLIPLFGGCNDNQEKIRQLRIKQEIYLQKKKELSDCPDGKCPVRAISQPLSYRNWTMRGEGSCAWASLSNAALAAGLKDIASDLRSKKGGGATPSDLRYELTKRGWKYFQTTSGDLSVLNYANNTRRVAVIWYRAGHSCAFNGWLKDGSALIVDPNGNRLEIIPRKEFLEEWNRRGGIATVVLSFPPGKNYIRGSI